MSSTRIWEDPTSSPQRHSNSVSKSGQLPSIAALTSELPPSGHTGPASPQYSAPNRSSDPWSQPQSTRKSQNSQIMDSGSLIFAGSSAYSSGLNGYGYSSSVTSPHRASNSSQLGATSHPADYNMPTSAGAQSPPAFSSPHNSLGLPNLNKQYNHEQSQYRSSQDFPAQE